jgi:hypothetical protein
MSKDLHYFFSFARFYEQDSKEFGFLTHYERILAFQSDIFSL